MSRGRNLAIIPGGFEDATIHCYGRDRTFLKNRKGLVKYALQHTGATSLPVYSFGESETYYTFTALLKQRLLLNQYSILRRALSAGGSTCSSRGFSQRS